LANSDRAVENNEKHESMDQQLISNKRFHWAWLLWLVSMTVAAQQPGGGETPATPDTGNTALPDEQTESYIPLYKRDEIADEVTSEMREQVIGKVLAKARTQPWGVPNKLPGWVDNMKVKGDIRLRAENQIFQTGYILSYLDIQKINEEKTFVSDPEFFLNTSEDRTRQRARFRLHINGKPSPNLLVGVGLTTDGGDNPVSTNTTLDQSFNRHDFVLDRAYLRYDVRNLDDVNWLTLNCGRMPNPFLSTDLVWDNDLMFEGLAGTLKLDVSGSADLLEMGRRNKTLFLTLGVFPLQEVELSSRDKWLYGAQLGYAWTSDSHSELQFGLSYYHFENVTGIENRDIADNNNDFSAPLFLQKGNALFDIRLADEEVLFALAAEYKEVDFTIQYDLAVFSPLHFYITADYVTNIAYDKQEIIDRSRGVLFRSGGAEAGKGFDAQTQGYQLKFSVGWPLVTEKGIWRASMAYKHLERDAVLDAFTDSDFHLGGTDAEGFTAQFEYGLTNNTWLSLRMISSNAIDSAPLDVDIFQFDLMTKF